MSSYQEAIDKGKFARFSSHSDITTNVIVTRILSSLATFNERNQKKVAKEIRVQAAAEQRLATAAQR